jgi:hypothetical protein
MTEAQAAGNQRPEEGWQLADAAERLHALGIHRPSEGAAIVMVPRDSAGDEARALGQLDDGPQHPPARIVTSRFTASDVRELIAAIARRDWSPEAQQHRYAFGYDPALDRVAITTSAPESERILIAERFGDGVHIQYAEFGFRR